MDKPKPWELKKKKIENAQSEVDDFESDDDKEEHLEYGTLEDISLPQNRPKKNISPIQSTSKTENTEDDQDEAEEDESIDNFDDQLDLDTSEDELNIKDSDTPTNINEHEFDLEEIEEILSDNENDKDLVEDPEDIISNAKPPMKEALNKNVQNVSQDNFDINEFDLSFDNDIKQKGQSIQELKNESDDEFDVKNLEEDEEEGDDMQNTNKDIEEFDEEQEYEESIKDDDLDLDDLESKSNKDNDIEFDNFETDTKQNLDDYEDEDSDEEDNEEDEEGNDEDESEEKSFQDFDNESDDNVNSNNEESVTSKPTSKEITKIIQNSQETQSSEQDLQENDEEYDKDHKINLHSYILHHKAKIIMLGVVFILMLCLIYISQVGFTIKNIPQNDYIALKKPGHLNVKYGFGKTLTFDDSDVEITLENGDVVKISGDFSIVSNIINTFSDSINDSHMSIKNANVEIHKTKNNSVQRSILQIITGSSEVFTDIRFYNTNLTVFDEKGNKSDNFVMYDIILQNMPDKIIAEGILQLGVQKFIVSYKDSSVAQNITKETDSNNFSFSLKSHIFDFAIDGNKKVYGTATKEDKIHGNIELVVRNPMQFASLFTRSKTIPKYAIGLDRFTITGNFEYSSLGDLIRIKDGKVNFLNSIGTFELITSDAEYKYKMDVNFKTMPFENISQYFKSLAFLVYNQSVVKNDILLKNQVVELGDGINLFSIIGDAKTLNLNISVDNIIKGDKSAFSGVQSSWMLSNSAVMLANFTMKAEESIDVSSTGGFFNLGRPNSFGSFDVTINGVLKEGMFTKKLLEFFTGAQLIKDIAGETLSTQFGVLFKYPSVIFNNFTFDLTNNFQAEGSLQLTETFDNSPQGLSFYRDITFRDLHLKDISTDIFNFTQGSTMFQKMVEIKNAYVENHYQLYNTSIGNNNISYANILALMQDGVIRFEADISSNLYTIKNNSLFQINNQSPVFKTNTILKNVMDFTELRRNISKFFVKDYIFLPSFSNFDGSGYIVIKDSKIFGESIPLLEINGPIRNGIFEFSEAKFSAFNSIVNDPSNPSSIPSDPPFEGKVSGKVDFVQNIPLFNINVAVVNGKTDNFKQILPISASLDGNIAGGGGFTFSGISYSEFLNSLQVNAKFVLQKLNLSKLNLNFLAQNLLKTHGKDLFMFDKDYIEKNFQKDDETSANVIFSIKGGDRKFVIDSCNIKTSYTAGVCAGNLNVVPESQIEFEAVSKFAVPALDINKDLHEVMRLYISSKAKYNSNENMSTVTSDLSQIYQYINYRRATFGI